MRIENYGNYDAPSDICELVQLVILKTTYEDSFLLISAIIYSFCVATYTAILFIYFKNWKHRCWGFFVTGKTPH